VQWAPPVRGSPTVATSATIRFAQPGSLCQVGLVCDLLQPLPAPLHAASVQPRVVVVDLVSVVPPTDRTNGDAAGNAISDRSIIASFRVASQPSSPELATTSVPGWF